MRALAHSFAQVLARQAPVVRQTLVVLAITAVLSGGLLEIVLRLFWPQYPPERQSGPLTGLYTPDPYAVYRNTPGARVPFDFGEFHALALINGQGLREDHTSGPSASGTTRILALGDSFTFGWGVSGDQAWPRLLNGPGVESLNAGVNGYGTDNEAAWLEAYGWPLRPRIVLVGFFVGNDVRDVMLGPDKAQANTRGELVPAARLAPAVGGEPAPPAGAFAQARRWLAEHSDAYVFLRALAHRLVDPPPAPRTPGLYDTAPFYYRPLPPDIAAGWAKATGILDSIRRGAQAHGAALVVVAIPTREQVEASYWQDLKTRFGLADAALDRAAPQRELAAWSARTGTPLIDLLPGFRAATGGPFYFRQDPHWNAAGHALAARLIRAGLAQRGLLPAAPATRP